MYLKEICAMMHTFGDVKEPNEKSVQLMQAILHDQMNLLLLEAEKIACIRRSREISHKDLLFLMRKNKMKLKRLLEYLQVLDLKETYNKYLSNEEVTFDDFKLCGKRVEKCLDFMASIEDCDELTSVMKDKAVIDITATKRKMRRYWMTCKMSSDEYEEFSKTSQASFCPLQKFKQWLLRDKVIHSGLTDSAVRIIDFLARETIAEMVDMVLILKMKKLGKYQPLYNDNFIYSIQTELNLEFSHESKQTNEKDHEKDYPISSNDKSSYDRDSRSEMIVKKRDNFKKNSYEDCKKRNIASTGRDEDLNEVNSKKSDLLSYNTYLFRRPQADEHVLQKEKGDCQLTYEILESGSESSIELNKCSKSIDEPEASYIKVDLNEMSNLTKSNPVRVDFENSTENVFSNRMHNQVYDLRDMSDDDIMYIPKSALLDRSNDISQKILPSNMSDTDLLYSLPDDCHSLYNPSNPLFNSASTSQGTPVAGTSYQTQENNLQIEDISDTSDYENFPREAVASCDHKKSLKRKIITNKHYKKIAEEESIIDNSEVANHLSAASQNEVKYITEPIEPAEIVEAFALFQEPSRMILIFAGNHVPRKTKLICLAESSSLNII